MYLTAVYCVVMLRLRFTVTEAVHLADHPDSGFEVFVLHNTKQSIIVILVEIIFQEIRITIFSSKV